MLQPSFFIVGAPKCGTTALCKYLNRHPDIFIPKIKELHFFDTDLKTKKRAASLQDYLAFFAEGGNQICGEGSPTYLYSKTAAAKIHRFNPDAKIIIMLREPVSMMYAFHSQHLFNGSSETVADFETALNLESSRKSGRNIPERCAEPQILFYREFAKFTEQVKQYFDVFDERQIKIIIFDDFKKNSAIVFQETLEFLDVDPEFQTTDFAAKNSNKKVRSKFVQTLLKYPPEKILRFGKYLLPIPRSWRRQLLESAKKRLKRLNTQKVSRTPLSSALKTRLTKEFESEIRQLERLIQRDLSTWYQDVQ